MIHAIGFLMLAVHGQLLNVNQEVSYSAPGQKGQAQFTAYSYNPEDAPDCPPAYNLILAENSLFIRSYCENGEKVIKFGNWTFSGQSFTETPSIGEEDLSEMTYPINIFGEGILVDNSTMMHETKEPLEEEKLLNLFGDFEIDDEEKCDGIAGISFYLDGSYTVVDCVQEDGGPKDEEGVFLVDCIEEDEITLIMSREGLPETRATVVQMDKDHISFQGINLKRCLTEDDYVESDAA